MVPPLPYADAGDILRAVTKDEEYLAMFETSVREFLLGVLPNSTISTPTATRLVGSISRLLYFLTTLRRGIPTTPGEEYAAIVPIRTHAEKTRLPSRKLLLAIALLHIVRLDDIKVLCRAVWTSFGGSTSFYPSAAVGSALEALLRLHLAVFYLYAGFHDIGHRMLNIRYMRVSPRFGLDPGHLKLLGVVTALHVLMDSVKAFRRAMSAARMRGRMGGRTFWKKVFQQWIWRGLEVEEEDEGRGKCILCLGGVQDATLTTCGHVFCWRCICNWCTSNVGYQHHPLC